MRGSRRAGRDNIWELKTTKENKVITRVFCVDDPQAYPKWGSKIKEMIELRKKDKEGIIVPKDQNELEEEKKQ